ncbi:MAG: hypothetical protein KAS96_02090 [Planctomycetes bacterium]|nr:hypothetical protein [Planctomycetota bacterium]
MSNFTKTLIILSTLSAIFLCGTVVYYVSSAEDYKQKNADVRAEMDASQKSEENALKQFNEEKDRKQRMEQDLNKSISALKASSTELKNSLDKAEREKAQLLQKVTTSASAVESLTKTNEQQGGLLAEKLAELKKVESQQIKDQKELNETTAKLIEKMAIIDTMDAKIKRLIEEKTDLQANLNKTLQPAGEEAVTTPITAHKSFAQPVQTITSGDIGLKGLITAVDMKHSMASISIGIADGVKQNMKFHVTRGSEFICDLIILDVESEEAVGILDLVQQQPMVGDNISTNL